MKKISYLVAPLMVLPFLVGCNKTKTYKVAVSSVSDTHLKFLSEDGKKDIGKVKATKGKDFKFMVKIEKGADEQDTPYKIAKDYVLVAVNGNILYDGVTVVPDNGEGAPLSAKVTVDKSKITGDIMVGGAAGIEGQYIYSFPVLAGITVDNITVTGAEQKYDGYLPVGGEVTITLSGLVGGLYYKDGAWTAAGGDSGITETTSGGTYTIAIGANKVQESIMIFARGGETGWLDTFSWSEIKIIAESGYAEDLFVIGDQKTITVNGQPHIVEIIGFNHDYIDEPTETDPQPTNKAGITFRFKTLISDAEGKALLTTWGKNHQDYVTSTLHKYVNETVFDMLPTDLKETIQPVYKKVGLYVTEGDEKKWEAKPYQAKLFPLSIVEYGKESAYDVSGEGDKYGDGIAENNLADAAGNLHTYWLRSPSTYQGYVVEYNNAFYMQFVTGGDARATDGDVSSQRAVAPAFAI